MKEIVVISGKGGTGKTSLTASFASLAGKCVVCDADVDGADLHLLLQPRTKTRTDFMGGGLAVINGETCTECDRCRELCRFGAISENYVVDRFKCEGCGVCVDLCPEQAIDFPIQKCGEWYSCTTRIGPMVHARLGAAEENSGKLVNLVRKEARKIAEETGNDLLITDGPPGIGCPVIAAIGGATVLVVIVEPTLSGLHDMSRVIDLAAHFRVPAMVCVNKFDLNLEMTETIEEHARSRNLMLLGRIPFDPVFVQAMVQGQNIIEYADDSKTAESVREVWNNIIESPVIKMAGIVNIPAAIS
ncbi:4Fe-4S binding protein [Desulfosediminicola flagellatus]|uniref:nucleotide-binding protein n=1 Tax=Desulfosediminicola flagellatus TaxID=2569541 RepID=UPI0010AB6AE1|nr:ATP-binding protein [Desulfosediminicola flagellatus]